MERNFHQKLSAVATLNYKIDGRMTRKRLNGRFSNDETVFLNQLVSLHKPVSRRSSSSEIGMRLEGKARETEKLQIRR